MCIRDRDMGAGIRLEIPYSMQSKLKALESVSYNLKKKFPEIRRNIKYDDDTMDLVLDFNTHPDDGGNWKQVTSEQARQMKTRMKASAGQAAAVTVGELTGLLEDPLTPS